MSPTTRKRRPPTRSRVEAARSRRRVPLAAIVVGSVALVLAVVVAVVVVSGDDDSDPGTLAPGDQAFGPVTATGTPLPDHDASLDDDPAVGQPAPRLEGETPSGEVVTIDPAEGPMVVAFLAHWCSPCQTAVPSIVELADGSGQIDGVPVAAVLSASDPVLERFPPGEWLAGQDWRAPVMVDTEPDPGGIPVAFATYGVSDFPFLVAVDADGRVAARSAGEIGEDDLRDLVAQVAEG